MFSFPIWLTHILLLRTYLVLIYNLKIQANLLDFNNLIQGQKSLCFALLSNRLEKQLLHKLWGKFLATFSESFLQVTLFQKKMIKA